MGQTLTGIATLSGVPLPVVYSAQPDRRHPDPSLHPAQAELVLVECAVTVVPKRVYE